MKPIISTDDRIGNLEARLLAITRKFKPSIHSEYATTIKAMKSKPSCCLCETSSGTVMKMGDVSMCKCEAWMCSGCVMKNLRVLDIGYSKEWRDTRLGFKCPSCRMTSMYDVQHDDVQAFWKAAQQDPEKFMDITRHPALVITSDGYCISSSAVVPLSKSQLEDGLPFVIHEYNSANREPVKGVFYSLNKVSSIEGDLETYIP